MEAPQERFALLRARLQDLRYHQPLGLESAPLVEQLLADLLRSNEQLGEQRSHAEVAGQELVIAQTQVHPCLLYTSPSPRDATLSRMPSSA